MSMVDYSAEQNSAMIASYIETFAGEPWFETWQPEWVQSRIDWLVKTPGFIGLVALGQNEEVLGAMLGYAQPFKDEQHFEVLELFVHPSAQGQGIGAKLLAELEVKLQQYEKPHIYLATAKDSGPETFYQKQGYQTSEQLCYMTKAL